jgi:hypothetical protein
MTLLFTMDDHVAYLSQVLSNLREHKLFVKKEKCEFDCTKIMFLGHLVSVGQVRMDSKKVQVILLEMGSFLGLVNCYL